MSVLRILRQPASGRRAVALLALASLFLVAAKCIDNETMYQDPGGNWHVVGEMRNDTDVWGAKMLVGGSLLDDAGNVLATGQAPACPFELAAHGVSVFDVEFLHSAGLHPTKYDVRPIGGKSLDNPLPPLQVSLVGFAARRSGLGVEITGEVRPAQPSNDLYDGCAAFYNSAGRVVREVILFGFGNFDGAPATTTAVLPGIPSEAVSVRLWFTLGSKSDPLSSDFAAATTGKLPIQ